MDIDALVPWQPDFYLSSPLFEPLRPWATQFEGFTAWPALADYQARLDALPAPIMTLGGAALKIVEQEGRPDCFEAHYAPRIYTTGEIQTRRRNWHDFFQYLTWFMFPRTKAVINAIHIPRARARIEGGGDPGRRSPVENMLSLFDEGGVVVISSDETLLQLIREFRWKELFWQRRSELVTKLRCIAFGHAVYEKALMPYIGMTANGVLLSVDQALIDMPLEEQLQRLDPILAARFEVGRDLAQPKDLSPFPILGMPGWDENNSHEAYYDNQRYFRPGRQDRVTA